MNRKIALRGGGQFRSISILLRCVNSLHQFLDGYLLSLPAVWMLPDLAVSFLLYEPSLALFLAPLSNPPLKSTHRHNPPLRQQVKQNNSLCHTIAPLPCSRLRLLYSMTFLSLSLSPVSSSSLVLNYFFSPHTIVTLIQQEAATVNCLTFLIVCWCCAVWSVSTLFSPIHQQRLVNVATFVWWESEVFSSYIFTPMSWNLSTLNARSAAATR